jgi:hypothetical protein
VLVRDDDGIEALRCDTEAREPRNTIAKSETTVDENAGGAGFDQQAVTFAAAAETGKSHRVPDPQ